MCFQVLFVFFIERTKRRSKREKKNYIEQTVFIHISIREHWFCWLKKKKYFFLLVPLVHLFRINLVILSIVFHRLCQSDIVFYLSIVHIVIHFLEICSYKICYTKFHRFINLVILIFLLSSSKHNKSFASIQSMQVIPFVKYKVGSCVFKEYRYIYIYMSREQNHIGKRKNMKKEKEII